MFEQAFKSIDDVLRQEAGCTTELDYTEQTSWMLFLKYLDDLEKERAMEAELVGKSYEFIIDEKHRSSVLIKYVAQFCFLLLIQILLVVSFYSPLLGDRAITIFVRERSVHGGETAPLVEM